jgi:hypothetical protein
MCLKHVEIKACSQTDSQIMNKTLLKFPTRENDNAICFMVIKSLVISSRIQMLFVNIIPK